MTSPVAINFNNCTFTSTVSMIEIGNGSIALGGPNQIRLAGTFSFSALDISNLQIVFENNSVGGRVDGSLTFPISPNGGSNPTTIIVNNFTGQASVNWNDGTGFAMLVPGEPVILIGLT